jgi:hypothetical protein
LKKKIERKHQNNFLTPDARHINRNSAFDLQGVLTPDSVVSVEKLEIMESMREFPSI